MNFITILCTFSIPKMDSKTVFLKSRSFHFKYENPIILKIKDSSLYVKGVKTLVWFSLFCLFGYLVLFVLVLFAFCC